MKPAVFAILLTCLQAAYAGDPALTTEYAPDVAWGDSAYLVTWLDGRNSNYEVYAARVTPQGVVLDPNGIRLAPGSSVYPQAVGFGAGVFLVVWHEKTTPKGVRATRVSQAGVVLDTTPIVISSSTLTYWSHPQPTFDGTNFLVTWHDDRDGIFRTYAARVAPGGSVLDPEGFMVSRRECEWERCAVATGGGASLIAWTDMEVSGWTIYGTRVAPDGTVLDTAAIPLGVDSAGAWSPAIAFDGANFLVSMSYLRDDDVYGVFVTPGGAVVDTPFALVHRPETQYRVDIAFDGENYFAVWEDCGTRPFGVMGARVTPAGVVLDPAGVAVDTGPGEHRTPKLAFDGVNYLVAWNDNRVRQEDQDVYAARVTPGAVVLDPGGFPVSARVGLADEREHSTARSAGLMPSVCRGSLVLTSQFCTPTSDFALLDALGRRLLDLHSGENDIRHLSPGIYFIQEEGPRGQGFEGSSVRKVVITR